MITAQDIREKTFDKSRINGYDMASVDDFLEDLAEDITATQKENAVLKSKMKVLVDKIEDYRANEEALNMAILSAQKLAVQIESEARQRAAAMIEDAEAQVKARVGSIEEETAIQERRLAAAQSATQSFVDSVRNLCNGQLGKLEQILQDLDLQPAVAEEPAPVDVDAAVQDIEAEIARVNPEPSLDLDFSSVGTASERGTFSSTQSFNL